MPSAGGRWSVRRTGAERASKVFDSKDQAVRYAGEIAKRDGSDLYIHRPDGLVHLKFTYTASNTPVTGKLTITYRDGPSSGLKRPKASDSLQPSKDRRVVTLHATSKGKK
jgi:hypothetical protein